uniref:Polysacc_synt_C domain-containing protein n=1 Tax=Macrostomum lignano TaxID=282301 RepID=A0A1I8H8R8_9PLAT
LAEHYGHLPYRQAFFYVFLSKKQVKWAKKVATYFLNFVILSESIIMCGRLGKLELDGAALANSIINGFGLSFGSGLVAACDTLFSQCYGSAYKKRFYYMYLIQARYLQNQDKVIVPMIVALIANAFNILSQYLGIYVWNFGFLCSPVCQCLTYALMAGTMLAYILISRVYRETWNGWSLQCLFNWWQFLRLALPGMGMVCLEIICYEIGTFIAGIIGTSELGAQSILFQTETLAYTCVLGFGVAVNIRVGQNLGANNGPGARLAWIAGICCLLCVASVLCAVFVVGKDFIPGLYTTDP